MSALHPPNFRQLKDIIVGNVNQRLQPAYCSHSEEQMIVLRGIPVQGSFLPECSTRALGSTFDNNATPTKAQSNDGANAKAAAELGRRKERNRLHQARYKKKQNLQMSGLEESIHHLQTEIQELRLQRQLMSLVPASKSTWSVAAEYFRLFRFGVKPSASVGATKTQCPFDPQVQRDFLLVAMAPDVTDGTVSGVSAIMERWGFLSLCCPGLAIELTCLENGPEDSIVASVQQNVTICESMLHNTFPHLKEADGEYSQLANKLLGHQLLIQGSVNFEWDYTTGRITRFVFKADMMTPMLRLLGNWTDVSRLFSKARLTPECGLVV